MLSSRQAEDFWELFGNSPLFTAWPEFKNEDIYQLDIVEVKANQTVFEPGGAPVSLYLVGRGVVCQTVYRDGPRAGPAWLSISHSPKQFFGQQALFSETYHSFAVAQEDTVLYLLSAAHLRMAMERNATARLEDASIPDLRDLLLRERLASRLRRVPLFRSLSDDQIYWLVEVVRENTSSEGTDLPLSDNPGLWVIDWGQVEVTGPVALYASLEDPEQLQLAASANLSDKMPSWRLTAGNFFLAGEKFVDTPCSALTATARLKTHTFQLPSGHMESLTKAFGDVQELIAKPPNIYAILKAVAESETARETLAARAGAATLAGVRKQRLFSGPGMRPEHYRHLAQFCGWEFVPAGQNVTTQGSVGHSFVIMREGKAIIHALDDQGRERPRNTLLWGEYYGETSLLEGKPRDASVRAQRGEGQGEWKSLGGADVITLDRRDLQYAFTEEPALWRTGPPGSEQEIPLASRPVWAAKPTQRYEWLDEGETVLWNGRAHFFWLLRPELIMLTGFALLLLIIFLVFSTLSSLGEPGELSSAVFWWIALILGLVGLVPAASLVALNYFLDYYVVTTRRVTRRDRQWPVYDFRNDIPIDMVQNVFIQIGFWGSLFGYGNLSIRTAAKAGALELTHVPDPETVKGWIETGSKGAIAAQRGREKEELRRQVISDLKLMLPIPERIRALGQNVPLPSGRGWPGKIRQWWKRRRGKGPEWLPGARRGKRALLPLVAKLPPQLRGIFGKLPPPIKPEPGQIIWRKHWINLIQRAGVPALCLLLWLIFPVVGVVTGVLPLRLPAVNPVTLLLVWLVLFVPLTFWLWYHYRDYRNDIYVVTDEKLIDIEAKPLSLSIQKREGSLERVQTISVEQKNLWANLLNYGDVIILTAAADPGFTFQTVHAPDQVRAIIFQKLDAFRRRQQEQGAKARRQELIEALDIYHQLQRERREPGIT